MLLDSFVKSTLYVQASYGSSVLSATTIKISALEQYLAALHQACRLCLGSWGRAMEQEQKTNCCHVCPKPGRNRAIQPAKRLQLKRYNFSLARWAVACFLRDFSVETASQLSVLYQADSDGTGCQIRFHSQIETFSKTLYMYSKNMLTKNGNKRTSRILRRVHILVQSYLALLFSSCNLLAKFCTVKDVYEHE